MSMITVQPQRAGKAKKRCRQISIMVLAASVQTALGFAILPSHTKIPIVMKSFPEIDRKRRMGQWRRSLSLKYADEDDNNAVISDKNDVESSSTTHMPIVVTSGDNIRYEKKMDEQNEDIMVNEDLTGMPLPSDISDAIKEVLTAPVVPAEEKEKDKNQIQQLILPITAAKSKKLGAPKGSNIAVSNLPSLERDTVANRKVKRRKSRFNLGRRWNRLRPGQKFRFRLGLASIAFVSLWNTVVIRNYGGFITGILTGAAATTTATGFGSLLRRWLSNRGFQGIAALGRSIAYGWAIFVAYPRLLDRRAKERRLKREEEAFDQWRRYLKGAADEVVRLRKELSLLEGEIRAFRREILAIRAARIDTSAATSKKNGIGDWDDNESSHGSNKNDNSNKSDRILREAIINEMTQLTRLRDDTRSALTMARKRWSEIRSKRPVSHSQSALTSAFDVLDFELHVASDFEYDGINVDDVNDDPLLTGF